MRTVLYIVALLGLAIACGCDYAELEKGAASVAEYTEKGAGIAPTLAPVAGPYAGMAGLVLSGIANIALAVKAFAANRKKDQLAKAAVIAAEAKPGGGESLNTAAALLNIGPEVRAAYEKALKDGTVKQ